MQEYININGSMKFVHKNKLMYLKSILTHGADNPFESIISHHEGEYGSQAILNHDEDSSMTIDLSGDFMSLGYEIEEHINRIIELGFYIYGSYRVYSDDGESDLYVIQAYGNQIDIIRPHRVSRKQMVESLDVNREVLQLSGSIDFGDSVSDDYIWSLFLDFYLVEAVCGVAYFHTDITTDKDLPHLVDILTSNKSNIVYCNLGLVGEDIYLEYTHSSSKDCFAKLDLSTYK